MLILIPLKGGVGNSYMVGWVGLRSTPMTLDLCRQQSSYPAIPRECLPVSRDVHRLEVVRVSLCFWLNRSRLPKSIAHIPVPVPTSSARWICCSFGMGLRNSFPC